ncbi:MAG: phosphatase PAP2 family protein [Peptoniphilus sp.]|nr:phosphatase PAP2 family protein [Peptoniphilus sp.]MDY6045145.1 phosphatase PAP2 family protein [Peptoniphilus sp.]
MTLSTVIKYQVIMLTLQVVLYFGCEYFQKNPHDVARPLDEKIPVIPLFTLIYILWFPVIALFPVHLFKASYDLYRVYMLTWIIDLAASIAIYMLYPTTFERPKNPTDYPGGWMLSFIYKSSYKGLNCMPSLHCSMSIMVLIFALLSGTLALKLKVIYGAVALGIIASTLFTKQHVVLDVVTGVLLGILSSLIAFAIL